MIKKCVGCGITLQDKDSKKIGYTPKMDSKYCQRCFKLKNYNEKEIIDLKYSNDDILNLLNKKNDTVIFITDFLNVSSKIIDVYKRINNQNKYLVINKTDYIPRSINKEKYINYIKETYNIDEKVILISAIKNNNINELNNIIKQSKVSYICGFTNSGKSTIINHLCEINNKKGKVLESLMPNTTLELIKIKLDENTYVYDTPGFVLDSDFDEETFPKKFIKPVTIQTKPNDIILINNKIAIKCDEVKNSMTFYMSDVLDIKKVYKQDIDFNNDININDNTDLIIYNYGFINIKNKTKIMLNTNNFEVRNSMF